MNEAEVPDKWFLDVENNFFEATFSAKTRKKCKLTFGEHMQWIILTFSPGPIVKSRRTF